MPGLAGGRVNINFTEREYRLLLDAIFLAEWVLTAHDVDQRSEDDPHQMLFQKLYSHAREAGCGELVEESRESNRYAASRKYEAESGILDRIDEYDDVNFWEELIERLTERDVYAELRDRATHLDAEEFWSRAIPYERKYSMEFEKNGLDRLVIDEAFRNPSADA